MTDNINYYLEELNNVEDDWESEDQEKYTTDQEDFANDLFDFLQSLINKSDIITEDFTSERELIKHYKAHCIADRLDRKSTKSNVYYDFTNIDKYREYENKISKGLQLTKNIIPGLSATNIVLTNFRKLFEGNAFILFSFPCGFTNNKGHVMLGLHSFASDNTQNYLYNTIDLSVLDSNYSTITMYPVDAHYLETKFNNIIKLHNIDKNFSFKINID